MTTPTQRYTSIIQQQLLLAEFAKQAKKLESGDFVVPADLMRRIYPSLYHATWTADLNKIAAKCPDMLSMPDQAIHLPTEQIDEQ